MTELFPTYTLGDLPLTSYPFAVEFGGDHGAPETVTELTQTLLADGDLVTLTRHGNREISLVVHVEGPSLGELAVNEAILRAECTKIRNDLVFQPGDFDSPASVFEVFSVSMKQPRDDEVEQHLLRRWELVFTCSGFPKSAEPTTIAAVDIPDTVTAFTVNDADTNSGWVGQVTDGTTAQVLPVIDAGSYVRVAVESNPVMVTASLTLSTSAIDMTATRFLRVEVGGTPIASRIELLMDGGWYTATPVLTAAIPGGKIRHHFEVRGTMFAGLRVVASSAALYAGVSIEVHDVTRTNEPPGASPRQTSRIIEVGGTERTPASLHAFVSGGFLGTTVLHTTRFDGSGYGPSMRQWRSSGNALTTNSDPRKITGIWEVMRPASVISRTPAHSMPRGDYILMAAIKSDTVGRLPIDWAVKSVASGLVFGSTEGTTYFNFTEAHTMYYVPLANLAAPVVRSGALDVEVHLLNPTSTVTMSVEEWWMFTDDTDSALSIVNTSEGNLWLDSPDASSSVPAVWVGPSKPGAYHPGPNLIAQGTHTFKPGPVLVTSISDSNDHVEVDMNYHLRWHSNAAE